MTRLWLLLAVLALVASACGGTGGDGPVAPSIPTEPGEVDGLRVRMTGPIEAGRLCPGGQRPCFEIVGSVETDGDPVRVVGTLTGGRLHVTGQEPLPQERGPFADLCDGIPAEADTTDVRQQLVAYQQSIPDAYAISWLSTSGALHFGVVGDAGPHQRALDDLGLGDKVCVVGDFVRSDAELAVIQDGVTEIMQRWHEDPTFVSNGWSRDAFIGAVVVDLYRIDAAMMTELSEPYGDAVTVNAAIEVLEGSLDDLDAALAAGAGDIADEVEVTMTCGAVAFSSVPADLAEFPTVDDEAQAALDAAAAGPIGVEAAGFVEGYQWFIASRTVDRMVLFGRASPVADSAELADFVFERADDEWVPAGFGGCQLSVSAVGLGPATMILDPDRRPDPAATELPVLIMERACASGAPPVDREIVPVVTETDSTVEVTVLVAPVKGAANCPGNPWHPISITLGAPLGDRAVFDASSQPPALRSWPPAESDLGS